MVARIHQQIALNKICLLLKWKYKNIPVEKYFYRQEQLIKNMNLSFGLYYIKLITFFYMTELSNKTI